MTAAREALFDVTALPVVERGPWLATATGGFWSIEHPQSRDVVFDDIALGLSRVCRFAGQIKEAVEFFAVSEHSTVMTDNAIESGLVKYAEDAMAILLHDAPEAYFGDMPTPTKAQLPSYKILEKHAQSQILPAFGLQGDRVQISDRLIKILDWRCFLSECDQLLIDPARNTRMQALKTHMPDLEPLDVQLRGLGPVAARQMFVDCFLSIPDRLPARDISWLSEVSAPFEAARSMQQRMAPAQQSLFCQG